MAYFPGLKTDKATFDRLSAEYNERVFNGIQLGGYNRPGPQEILEGASDLYAASVIAGILAAVLPKQADLQAYWDRLEEQGIEDPEFYWLEEGRETWADHQKYFYGQAAEWREQAIQKLQDQGASAVLAR